MNRTDKERKVHNIFYNQPQGTRVRGRPKNQWIDCVFSDIKMQNQELKGVFEGQRDMEEVHYGGEGPHWAVVPMKKINKLDKIFMCFIVIYPYSFFCYLYRPLYSAIKQVRKGHAMSVLLQEVSSSTVGKGLAIRE